MQKRYSVVGEKGRIYLPRDLQEKSGIQPGSIVRLTAEHGRILLIPMSLIEAGDHSPQAVESYLKAASRQMEKESRLSLAIELLQQTEAEETDRSRS